MTEIDGEMDKFAINGLHILTKIDRLQGYSYRLQVFT